MWIPFDSVHLRQMVKFGIVGVGNTTIDFGVYYVLTRGFAVPILLASSLSWLMAVTFGFTMNKFWTFRMPATDHIAKEYVKFFMVSAVSLILSLLLLALLVHRAHIYDLFAKLMTIGIIVFWNFFMNKFWTFKRR